MCTTFKFFVSFLFCFALLVVSGCGGGTPALVGKWEQVSVENAPFGTMLVQSFELRQDSTGVTFPSGDTTVGSSVSWRAENNRLAFITVRGTEITSNYKISGSTLTLTFDNGMRATYKRQR